MVHGGGKGIEGVLSVHDPMLTHGMPIQPCEGDVNAVEIALEPPTPGMKVVVGETLATTSHASDVG